jgi:hypothetical protein
MSCHICDKCQKDLWRKSNRHVPTFPECGPRRKVHKIVNYARSMGIEDATAFLVIDAVKEGKSIVLKGEDRMVKLFARAERVLGGIL